MRPSTLQLLIELDPAVEPISGTLRQQPDGASTPFHGWLQLTETVEAIRRAARTAQGNTAAPDRHSHAQA
jgi:hypothetical protein